MTRRGSAGRSMVAGFALTAVAAIVGVGGGGTAFANPPTPSTGHIRGTAAAGTIKGSYIVVLKNAKASQMAVHADSAALAKAFGGKVGHEYSHTVRGFSATMTESQATRLAADSRVAYVEQNRTMHALDTQGNPPSWGLDRIDQTFLPLNNSYGYPTDGTGVRVYVIDTGIHIGNTDFGGRASYGRNFVTSEPSRTADDCAGHGTHVAGTIGGTRYGVAKGASLISVRVLDCTGGGVVADVVAGIDWVTANAPRGSVANMSLGGTADSTDTSIEDAMRKSISTAGVTYTVAAGNESTNACNDVPADVTEAITVGAINKADFRADFSNYGSCVDVFAPGVGITSDWYDNSNPSNASTAVEGGTSMAAPHVAGAAALLLQANPAWTPAQVAAAISRNAVPMAVHGAGTGSPNRLLNVNGTGRSTTISLRSHTNGLFVTSDPSGKVPLIANRYLPASWETFDVIDAGNGWSALRSHANGRYVSAEAAGAMPLIVNRGKVGGWELFKITSNPDGSVTLLAFANGRYVTAENNGASALIANRTGVGSWESFDEAGPYAVVSLVAEVNGRYVTAESAGAKPLIANRTGVGSWEQFDMVDRGGGWMALRSHANGKFVTAQSAGARPLIATRTGVGSWESFFVESWGGDGSINLRSAVNGDYVAADSAGAQPLIANRANVSGWEVFMLA